MTSLQFISDPEPYTQKELEVLEHRNRLKLMELVFSSVLLTTFYAALICGLVLWI
ncbi:MAG: hypothetical protein MN733_01510 [Nitrososphaera sp.]|nr:hypothetical protein [Nitrososphaera sp.]